MTPIPIVALDLSDEARALELVNRLGASCRLYKIGSELFTAAGPGVVGKVRETGADVFLDLKFHDIPTTVRGAVRAAAGLGAKLVTVHGSGGRAMMQAAVDGAGSKSRVLAVSVLTSLDARALEESWGRRGVEVVNEVLRLADLAAAAGIHGLVCSGAEARRVREHQGNWMELLIPGIRLAGEPTHDQARVVTPREAADAGATYIVVGRAVTQADDPRAAMETVNAELSSSGA